MDTDRTAERGRLHKEILGKENHLYTRLKEKESHSHTNSTEENHLNRTASEGSNPGGMASGPLNHTICGICWGRPRKLMQTVREK